MNTKKICGAITAALMAVAALGTAIPVNAVNTYTPVQGTSVQFEKYLVFDTGSNTPSATFTFTVSAGQGQAAQNPTKATVLAGDDVGVTVHSSGDSSKSVIENITVSDAVFAASNDKWDSPQATESGIGQKTGLVNDPVDLGSEVTTGHYEKSYSRQKVTVDFSKVQFDEPGVYRYVITETAMSAAQTELGFVADADNTRYLDVYVKDNGFTKTSGSANSGTGTLEIVGYVLHNTDNFQPTNQYGDGVTPLEPIDGDSAVSSKAKGFINTHETHDLKIKNDLVGNQASTDKYFKFTLTLADAGANSLFDVDLTAADATVQETSSTVNTYEGQTNAASITTDANGAATYVFYLQHNQEITVKGLPLNASYSIESTSEDYDVSAVITGDTISGKEGATPVAISTTGSGAAKFGTVADADMTADTTVAFTQTRMGTIPTGVINSVLPGAMILVIAGIGVVLLGKRRSAEE